MSAPGKPDIRDHHRKRPILVESRCGAVALDRTYLLPPLSSGDASLVPPWLRFHIPLIEPDVQISRIRLSDKTSRLRGGPRFRRVAVSCQLPHHAARPGCLYPGRRKLPDRTPRSRPRPPTV